MVTDIRTYSLYWKKFLVLYINYIYIEKMKIRRRKKTNKRKQRKEKKNNFLSFFLSFNSMT